VKEEFRVFGRPETALPFAVEMAGISYCDGSYRIDRPHSPITVMEYVIRGQGTLQTRGRTFTAKGGDVYILHRGDSHLYYADPRDPWIKLFFNVSGPLPEQLLEAYHLDGETLLPGCPVEGLFRDFFRLARLEEPADAFRQCALKFHEIAAAVSAARREDRPPEEALRLKRLLDSRISSGITVGELAQAIYHSPDYTIKLFKASFGTTPYAYLMEQRMFAAQNLLRSTSLPVKEIALRTGFEDPHYFSNLFKKRCGLSPARYRCDSSKG
jgi:AraC family transcriptional regulator of arabinose operon